MRIGKFYIAEYLVKEQPDQVVQVLFEMRFVPTRVEYIWLKNSFLMEGISSKFKGVCEGTEIPFYEIIINDLQEGKISVSVR